MFWEGRQVWLYQGSCATPDTNSGDNTQQVGEREACICVTLCVLERKERQREIMNVMPEKGENMNIKLRIGSVC